MEGAEKEQASTSEPTEEKSTKSLREKAKQILQRNKNFSKGLGLSLSILLGIYLALSIYFMDHFYFGTQISSVSVSGKTQAQAKKIIATGLQDYTLTIKGRDGADEQIKGKNIDLQYTSPKDIEQVKEIQNPWGWVGGIFNKDKTKVSINLSLDEKLLYKEVNGFSYFHKKNIKKPQSPRFQYRDKEYSIVDEIPGNQVDKKVFTAKLIEAILNSKPELDLELSDCYVKPEYHSQSPEVLKARDTLNQYVSSKITYTFGEKQEILDGSTLNRWLGVDGKFQVTIDEEKGKEYISSLAETYNTLGKVRSFVTSTGKSIKIGGGDYGWAIDKGKELERLIQTIKTGKTVKRKPEYKQEAFAWGQDDIGDTYVEIDLTGQQMWFYKDGSLVTQGSVVTGNVQKNHTTPPGVFALKYKSRNVVLRGPGYASPVTFWMPFNGGIGIHDASWRNVFGGNIYKTNGSHGCINSPYPVAQAIFDNIEPGTPVICY